MDTCRIPVLSGAWMSQCVTFKDIGAARTGWCIGMILSVLYTIPKGNEDPGHQDTYGTPVLTCSGYPNCTSLSRASHCVLTVGMIRDAIYVLVACLY